MEAKSCARRLVIESEGGKARGETTEDNDFNGAVRKGY